jgi:hypothetical protein
MESREEEGQTQKLTKVLAELQYIYHKKKDYLEELKEEINQLHEVISNITMVISTRSFTSADELLSQSLSSVKNTYEDLFKEDVSHKNLKGTTIKRKIFSKEKGKDETLLCILNFIDFKTLEIKFIDPEKRSIRETSEDFVNLFLKGALIKIKEQNPTIERTYHFYKNTDIIERITIYNLNSMKDYDLITEKIQELLA